MKRGEIWTAAGGQVYAGKPRPVVIVQSDRFSDNDSITVCPFTSDNTPAPILRLVIEPDEGNGLKVRSRIIVDKLVSLPRTQIGKHLGHLDADDLERLDRAILVFLGLAK